MMLVRSRGAMEANEMDIFNSTRFTYLFEVMVTVFAAMSATADSAA